ncbi:MAG: OmpP1/FadL family transporter [Bacteroidia bacterium]
MNLYTSKLLFSALLLTSFSTFAQSELDAIRYSTNTITGTARSLGAGGAFSAVGGDMSAGSLNPAGFGLYQFSDLTFTPTFRMVNNNNSFLNKSVETTQTPFQFSNIGAAFTVNKDNDREHKLKNITFALGYNQVENYTKGAYSSGYNEKSSITDFFVQRANGTAASQLNPNSYAGLAYNTYLIDNVDGSNSIYYPMVNNGRVQQTIDMVQSGRKNEWFFSMAGNWDNKLYLGASMGISSLRYNYELNVIETDINNLHQQWQTTQGNTQAPMKHLEFNDAYATTGSGVNFQGGIIYRPIENLRLGLSFKSPTILSLKDEYQTTMKNTPDSGAFIPNTPFIERISEDGVYNYTLRTPYNVTAGAMYLFGKRGFISADVDVTDYKTIAFREGEDGYNFSDENKKIRQYTNLGINYRLGAEARLKAFRLRAGFAMFASPVNKDILSYQQNINDLAVYTPINPNRRVLSFGAGYRQKSYYIDVAFINQNQTERFDPYTLTTQGSFTPSIINKRVVNSVVATMGVSW